MQKLHLKTERTNLKKKQIRTDISVKKKRQMMIIMLMVLTSAITINNNDDDDDAKEGQNSIYCSHPALLSGCLA